MPANLLKTHQLLERTMDAAYGYKVAQTNAARVAFLFAFHQKSTSFVLVEKAKNRES